MTEARAELQGWQAAAVLNPYDHFAFFGGVGVGKTFTGAHFAIRHIVRAPHLTGFIGANTYDQLSQATLRELFYWLEAYGLEYVIDCAPAAAWGYQRKRFKKYTNILSVRVGNQVAFVFTRVLSAGDALRGLEFSWYWLDETRDTPKNTHDVILSRMRETDYRRGIITTTTNGEDWAYERFVKGNKGGTRYGSSHIPTLASVEAGILTQDFYETLLASYSPLMAAQELRAQHVNTLSGRAYYAASEENACRLAPWGDEFPDPSRPVYVGCDFNFSPAPLVWTVFQLCPDEESAHVFENLWGTEVSTEDMGRRLAAKYGEFFMHVIGDASGNVGTTSNAGATDYNQLATVLEENNVAFNIDVGSVNPMVKDRVENVNRLLLDGRGIRRLTYCSQRAPLLHEDMKRVGWKKTPSGAGKLDDRGDSQLTHASDGLGYALWRLFPSARAASISATVTSAQRAELRASM